jgi:hypothetical protein
MFEKVYTRLLRLYPSPFRKQYADEALQLLRDRHRDETGFFKRARLLWDLVVDVFVSLPQEYRNSDAVRDEPTLSASAEGIPSFMVLEKEPLGRGAILLGSALSVTTVFAFGLLVRWSMDYLPVPGSNGRITPIQAVVERLNRATTPDAGEGDGEGASESTSVGASEPQPRAERAASLAPASSSTASPAAYLASATGSWRGVLTDANARPVRSAEIHLIGGHGELVALTGEDGSFAFSEVALANFEVAVVLAGREIAYLKTLPVKNLSTPSKLTLAPGGRLVISSPGK